MRLNRRAFLQQAGLALGALGIGGTALLASSNQYAQALAKPARRKLALLIGINAYPDRALDPGVVQNVALKGCLTDVELQRQLLVHRFGFQSSNVVTLTNQDATRAGILTAIDEHLVQQAQPDDVVLLHFSGYGSQVRVQGTPPGQIYPAWVTVDSRLPSEDSPALGDVLEAEIAQRLGQLATANLTTVIDAGCQDTGYLRWGNSRVRSRPTVPTGLLPQTVGDDPLNLATPWPGLLLRAAAVDRLVLESVWEGFSAGVFTYALTQSLWDSEPALDPELLMQRAGQRLQRWVGADQQPILSDRLSRAGLSAYGLPAQMPPAEGVVLPMAGEDRPLSLWLGGVPPLVLRYLQPGARLVAETTAGSTLALRLESRTGLRAVAKPGAGISPLTLGGTPVYEQVRLLPQAIDLVVALDSQLKRVERVDATSALANIPFVTSAPAGERSADCLFGRLSMGPAPPLTAALPRAVDSLRTGGDAQGASQGGERPAESSYGLFAPNRTLLPGTLLAKDEAVKTAVNRLTPYLQTLLALKLVRLTENRSASQLRAAALLETIQPKPKPILVQTTQRPAPGVWPKPIRQAQKALTTPESLLLSRDSRVGYRLVNGSAQALHMLWISFDSRGDCLALITQPNPAPGDAAEATLEMSQGIAPLAPGQMVTLPNDDTGWAMPGAAIWVEAHTIFSTQPLERCLAVLRDSPPSLATGFRPVPQALKLAEALLQDLAVAPAAEDKPVAPDYYALHHDRWATLSFRYAVA